ncbi:MAG: DUF3108 domain-containing protein [Cyclobacteriaceae bacterium]|nr:DUF3108 domain-containing protein [Cyclobacteriaceae bacterium]MCB0499380.1 DUF3108 domain-containing protein [Cyclobacteriaceae bacterium]MCB9236458.1 DUF3108 domain-containing protein [Flammeovirgaceae bacterium]MCO5272223.1 DUF3108 domain-containing protein [Cyclobacteriaceae bacterium]MCW5902081.1 DUF3108 domain-containing protein [Cyclobacteriaceae bacterium]
MDRLLIGFVLFLGLSAFAVRQEYGFPEINNTSFGPGEEIHYRVNFGFFTVGSATTKVDKKIFRINSRPSYKVDAFGATSGMVSWITKVDDQWGAYIDTAALITHVSYRKIKEGRYRKDELTTFDHAHNKAEVKVRNKKTGVYDDAKVYDTPDNVRDLVGGFLYLRVIEFEKLHKGDTITISGFFEDTSYNLDIIYDGKEVIHTRVGKIRCLKLVPIMPDNKLFDGENSITCWISDDGNKIPVKIQAKMFIGSTGIEMVGFRGLRNPLKVIFD